MNRSSLALTILVISLILTACSSDRLVSPTNSPTPINTNTSEPTIPPTLTPSPTITLSPIPTSTSTPVPTATITSTPIPKIPVSLDAPLPEVNKPLSKENANQIKMLANYERYDPGQNLIKLTLDGKYYFVVTTGGIDIYDVQSEQLIHHLNILLRQVYGEYFLDDLQFSQDTSRFMARVSDDKVAVYNLDGQEIYAYSFPSELYGTGGAGLSPDGKYLAIDICSDCNAFKGQPGFRVIDIESGDATYEYGHTKGGEARGWRPFFSPDGQVMATQIGSQVYLWDTQNWKHITDFSANSPYINQRIAFSPDSTYAAILGYDFVAVWQWKDRQLKHTFKTCVNNNSVPQTIFSPDDAMIAVLNCGKIDVWKIADGSQISEQKTSFAFMSGMSLGADGNLAIYQPKALPGVVNAPWNSWYKNGSFQFDGDGTSLQLNFVGHSYPGNACSISYGGNPNCAEGDFVVGSDRKFYQVITDQTHKTEIRPGIDGQGNPIFSFNWNGYLMDSISLDPAHQLFMYNLWSTPNNSTATLMDMTNKRAFLQWPNMYFSNNPVVYSPDGNLAAFILDKNPGSRLIIYDLKAKRIVYQVDSLWNSLGGTAFSPDGKSLVDYAAKSGDQKPDFYYVMDLATPFKSIRFGFPLIQNGAASATSYAPDGALLAIGYSNGVVRLFDGHDGSMIYEWQANGEYVTGIAFSKDMKYLASASMDGTIRIWGVWP